MKAEKVTPDERSWQEINDETIALEVATHIIATLIGQTNTLAMQAENRGDYEEVARLEKEIDEYSALKYPADTETVKKINTMYAAKLRALNGKN